MLIEVIACMLRAFFLSLIFAGGNFHEIVAKTDGYCFWKSPRDFCCVMKDIFRKHFKRVAIQFLKCFVFAFTALFLMQHFLFKDPESSLLHYAVFDLILALVFLSFLAWFTFYQNKIQNFVVIDVKTGEIVFSDPRDLPQNVRKVLWKFRVHELNFFREEIENQEKITGRKIENVYFLMFFQPAKRCVALPYLGNLESVINSFLRHGVVDVYPRDRNLRFENALKKCSKTMKKQVLINKV